MRAGFLLSLCLVPCPTAAAIGQTPDPVPAAITPQNNTGDLPYSTTVGSEVEHVELASGNLIVLIPFASVLGRKMSFDYGIRFDAGFGSRKATLVFNIGHRTPKEIGSSQGLWAGQVPRVFSPTLTRGPIA